MRARIEERQEPVHHLDVFALAGEQLVERRILDRETVVAHGAVHTDDGMAGGASQPGVRFRRVDLLLDGPVEAPVEKHGVVVAAGAPLARLRPDYILHVLDGLAVELIIERAEVVRRAVPLFVDVGVAFAAPLRVHEEIRRDNAAGVGLGRGREEGRVRPAAFLLHRRRHHHGVLDAIRRRGRNPAIDRRRRGQQRSQRRAAQQRPLEPEPAAAVAARLSPNITHQEQRPQRSRGNMRPKSPAMLGDVSVDCQIQRQSTREEK